MSVRAQTIPVTDDDLVALIGPLRRYVRARTWDPELAEDVVQETLARVWEARQRLERTSLLAYGLVTARNLVASEGRARAVAVRHQAKLAESDTREGPEQDLVASEERAALREAMSRLSAEDRSLLLDHEVAGVSTSALAQRRGLKPGAIAAALARARARLRVEHLLTLERVVPPTPRCRPVLLSLSMGDRRRQVDLGTGNHVLDCPACGTLSQTLLRRRRSLGLLAPLALIVAFGRWLQHKVRLYPVRAATAAGVVTAGAVAATVFAALPEPHRPAAIPPPAVPSPSPLARQPAAPSPSPLAPQPASPSPGTLLVGVRTVLPAVRVGNLGSLAGQPAVATQVRVDSVPADEGFWIGAGPGRRIWVELRGTGESPQQIRPGDVVSFTGTLVPIGRGARPGLDAAEGAGEAAATEAMVSANRDSLIHRRPGG